MQTANSSESLTVLTRILQTNADTGFKATEQACNIRFLIKNTAECSPKVLNHLSERTLTELCHDEAGSSIHYFFSNKKENSKNCAQFRLRNDWCLST